MQKKFITDQRELDDYCDYLLKQPMIAVDTEFMRVKTLYPEFALLQIADKNTLAIIDPLTIKDWSAFKKVLTHDNTKKIFHAASEDLVLFWHSLGCLPFPYIDTQVLGAFINNGASLGLANALKQYLNINIAKDQTRTDWLKRPLTEDQIEYAYLDVAYLIELYEVMLPKFSDTHLQFALDECATLSTKISRPKNPEKLYISFPFVDKLKSRELAILKELAKWRFKEAQTRNLALNFIVHEKNLVEIARISANSLYALNKIGLHNNEITHHGKAIIDIVNSVNTTYKTDDYPPIVTLVNNHSRYKKDYEQIKHALMQIADENGLSIQLLCSRKQLNQLLQAYYMFNINRETEQWLPLELSRIEEPLDLLTGWRAVLCSKCLNELQYITD